jgi:hypothetical protein
MIFPEEQHRSKERHSCRSSYCHSDSRGRRRDNTAAAAIHSPRRIGCHPDWRFRSSGTPCSPSRSEHHSSLGQYADGGEHRQMGRDRQRASWSTSQCADDPALRHAVHLPLTVGHPLWVKTGKAPCEHMFSALPLRADIAQRSRHVRFVPTSDSCTAANTVVIRSPRRRWLAASVARSGLTSWRS